MKNTKLSKKTSNKKQSDPLDKDLSGLFDMKGWKKVKFEIKPKNKTITLRISEELLEAIKSKADDEGVEYQKWIRSSLEDALKKGA